MSYRFYSTGPCRSRFSLTRRDFLSARGYASHLLLLQPLANFLRSRKPPEELVVTLFSCAGAGVHPGRKCNSRLVFDVVIVCLCSKYFVCLPTVHIVLDNAFRAPFRLFGGMIGDAK